MKFSITMKFKNFGIFSSSKKRNNSKVSKNISLSSSSTSCSDDSTVSATTTTQKETINSLLGKSSLKNVENVKEKYEVDELAARKPGIAPRMWTPEEDELLKQAVDRHGTKSWKKIANDVPSRTHVQCLQRYQKVIRSGLVKGAWSPSEDSLLTKLINKAAEDGSVLDWKVIAEQIEGRSAKQCRERWFLNLDPSINHGEFSHEEEIQLVQYYYEMGSKWSTIAKNMPGRTENSVKTRFNTIMRREAKARGWSQVDDLVFVVGLLHYGKDLQTLCRLLHGRSKSQLKKRFNEIVLNDADLAKKLVINDQKLRDGTFHPPEVHLVEEKIRKTLGVLWNPNTVVSQSTVEECFRVDSKRTLSDRHHYSSADHSYPTSNASHSDYTSGVVSQFYNEAHQRNDEIIRLDEELSSILDDDGGDGALPNSYDSHQTHGSSKRHSLPVSDATPLSTSVDSTPKVTNHANTYTQNYWNGGHTNQKFHGFSAPSFQPMHPMAAAGQIDPLFCLGNNSFEYVNYGGYQSAFTPVENNPLAHLPSQMVYTASKLQNGNHYPSYTQQSPNPVANLNAYQRLLSTNQLGYEYMQQPSGKQFLKQEH